MKVIRELGLFVSRKRKIIILTMLIYAAMM